MRLIRSTRCSVLAVGVVLILAPDGWRLWAADPALSAATGEIVVRVIDTAGAPQADAAVSFATFDNDRRLFKEMSPILKADRSGVLHIERLSAENGYYLVRVRAGDGLVGYRTCLLDGKDAKQRVDITVLRPQAATIHVRDESGKPIAGATIWSLSHRGVNARLRGLNAQDLNRAMGFPIARSNEGGDLPLPELPEGIVDVKLVHPDYAPAFVSDFALKSGGRRNIVVHRGVRLTLHIEADGKSKLPSGLLMNLGHVPYDDPSTLDGSLPEPGPDGTIQITVSNGKYSSLRLTHPDFIITPQYYAKIGHGPADDYEYFTIAPDANSFTFQLHRKIKIRGRVLREGSRKPLADTFVSTDLRSPAQQGPFARFALNWTQAGFANTNERGEFELELAAGHASLQIADGGFMSPTRYQFDVATDGSTVAPDIVVKPIPKVRGIVKDKSGKPLAGAVVRFRGSELSAAAPTIVTDDSGHFEISPPFIPVDWKTEESRPLQTIVAFHPYEPLAAEARIDLQNSKSLENIALQVKHQEYDALVAAYPAELSAWDRGVVPADQKDHLAAMSLVGKPAPELDGVAWLNTEKPKMSLADFRGKYVLLQIWATWCGPCHYDMPSVKLANQLYKDKGLVVIGIHDNSMPLEDVKADAAKNGLTYPIVVDRPDGRLLAAYNGHGFEGYPSYILIGPDGRIVKDDETVAGPSLRSFKVEIIRQQLMSPQAGVGAALRVENGKVLVTSIVPDSAAARTDLIHPNDQIISIAEEQGDAVDVAGRSLEQVVGLIRGRNGTVIRLTVIPAGKEASAARVVSLTRGHVTTSFGGLGDGKLLSPGTVAPNFKFTRLSDASEDELDHHRGNVVVLVAWASWCKPCIEHLAKLDALAAEHPDWIGRVEILPVSIDERRDDAADSAKAHHWTNVSAAWSGPAICDAYHINGLPLIYVIGRDGKIVDANSPLDILKIIQQQHLLNSDDHQQSERKTSVRSGK